MTFLDETTFYRFCNKSIKQGKLGLLLNKINTQLEYIGLKVKSANTAIVDATIIKSNTRPCKTLEPQGDKGYETKLSAEVDARWLKKGKESYFGYQGFARVDAEGFIDKAHVTLANLAETKELLDTMSDGLDPGIRVMTDKGFASKENREMLRVKRLKTGLMYKATNSRSLTEKQSLFNKLVSKVRWRVEQCFATSKTNV